MPIVEIIDIKYDNTANPNKIRPTCFMGLLLSAKNKDFINCQIFSSFVLGGSYFIMLPAYH